jgi:hypothetical protein
MTIDIKIFDPNYWMFTLGVSLHRYEECTDTEQWIRKELEIGLLLLSINFNFIFSKRKRED